jgi:hypothetical protein
MRSAAWRTSEVGRCSIGGECGSRAMKMQNLQGTFHTVSRRDFPSRLFREEISNSKKQITNKFQIANFKNNSRRF